MSRRRLITVRFRSDVNYTVSYIVVRLINLTQPRIDSTFSEDELRRFYISQPDSAPDVEIIGRDADVPASS